MDHLSFIVCIPAAGEGKRMQSSEPKQYLELLGVPILVHTLRVFDSMLECGKIIIASNDEVKINEIKSKFQIHHEVVIVKGGETRQHSVMNCLNEIHTDSIVLVHDAVRPCVTHEEIRAVVQAIKDYGAALLAMPTRDTIKRVDESHLVLETIPRQEIFQAQTPQGAIAQMLKQAYRESLAQKISFTDDVQVLERKSIPVKVVEGKPTNIKITTPDDLIIAETILKNRLNNRLE